MTSGADGSGDVPAVRPAHRLADDDGTSAEGLENGDHVADICGPRVAAGSPVARPMAALIE